MLDKIQCADRALVLDRRWDTSSIWIRSKEKWLATDAEVGGKKVRGP